MLRIKIHNPKNCFRYFLSKDLSFKLKLNCTPVCNSGIPVRRYNSFLLVNACFQYVEFIEKYTLFTCWHDHVGQLFQAWEENGREAGCSCRAWNGEEEKDMHYVHERMELNFNKKLCLLFCYLKWKQAFIFW